jgi:hypothetical protein
MSTITLVCSCGMRMKAPGAVPGRVGKCPRCGSFLKVPEGPSAEPVTAPEAVPNAPGARPATFVKHRSRGRQAAAPRGKSDGFVSPPRMAETRYVDSLLYPLWNASGIALLAFMPPLLWFCTAPMFVVLGTMDKAGINVLGFIFLVPQLLLMATVGGYILLFLGQVLVTSSLGEVAQPRSPGWDISEISEGLGRWFWALIIGGVIGGLPALTYWITCGEVDLFDKIVLVDLLLPGMAYAQMGLLATLLHESPLAANPVTVTRSIIRVGWSYIAPCAETGAVLVVMTGFFSGVLRIKNPIGQSVACWLFWLVALYVSMVLLRRLGLYCYRNAVVLEWFPERSRSAR